MIEDIPPGFCSTKDYHGLTVYDWINFNKEVAAHVDIVSKQNEWLNQRYRYFCEMWEIINYDDIYNNPDNIALAQTLEDAAAELIEMWFLEVNYPQFELNGDDVNSAS